MNVRPVAIILLCLFFVSACTRSVAPKGSAEGYAGGDPPYLQSARAQLLTAMRLLRAGYDAESFGNSSGCTIDLSLCQTVADNVARRADLKAFLDETLEDIIGLNSTSAVGFTVSDDKLTVRDPQGTDHTVSARTFPGHDGKIEYYRPDVESMTPWQRVAVMAHEFGHKATTGEGNVLDFVTYRGMLGKDFLNYFGAAIAKWISEHPYPAIVLYDRPVGLWMLSESSDDSVAQDRSPHTIAGRYNGVVARGASGLIANLPDTAARFSSDADSSAASDNTVSVAIPASSPDTIDIRSGALTTVEAWFNWDGDTHSDQVLFGFWGLGIMFHDGALGLTTGKGDLFGFDARALAGKSTHIAIVFANPTLGALEIYIDGKAQTLAQIGPVALTPGRYTATDFSIGGWPAYFSKAQRFAGVIGGVAVYNGRLSPDCINLHYELGGLGMLKSQPRKGIAGTGAVTQSTLPPDPTGTKPMSDLLAVSPPDQADTYVMLRALLSTGRSFQAPRTLPNWTSGFDYTLADMNGDGTDDIVGVQRTTGTSPRVGLVTVGTDGSPTFATPTGWGTIAAGAKLTAVAGSGARKNLVAVLPTPTQVSIALGINTGSTVNFVSPAPSTTAFDSSFHYVPFATGVIAIDVRNGKIYSIPFDGTGTLGTPRQFGDGAEIYAAPFLADVNGDGKLDIITANPQTQKVIVRLANGAAGDFDAPVVWQRADPTAKKFLIADVNGDGAADLIVHGADGKIRVGLAQSGTHFASPTEWGGIPDGWTLTAGNLDGK